MGRTVKRPQWPNLPEIGRTNLAETNTQLTDLNRLWAHQDLNRNLLCLTGSYPYETHVQPKCISECR